MRSAALFLMILCLGAVAAAAPYEFSDDTATPPPPRQDELLLNDGTLLLGTIIEERADVVVFETAALGRMEIRRADIVRLAHGGERAGAIADPDYNSLMFCPTPATLARGDSYFRDFELFVLNFGTSLTDAFDLSVGTLFPISADVLMITVVDRERQPLGLALVGGYTRLEEVQFGSVGVVAGVGNRRNSLNLAVNRTYDDDGDTETVLMAGADYQATPRSKFFVEYMSTATLLEDEDDDLHGFLNLGVRLFGDSHSFTLSGFRPLTDDTGSFIAFPMIMYSNHW